MTKVEAIKKLMQDNGGLASWKYIYENIQNTLSREPYSISRDRFIVKTYNEAIDYYKKRLELEKLKF